MNLPLLYWHNPDLVKKESNTLSILGVNYRCKVYDFFKKNDEKSQKVHPLKLLENL